MAERSLATKCNKCGSIPHFQDELYGEGNRLHNKLGNGQWRCTVCLNVKGEIKKETNVKEKKKK